MGAGAGGGTGPNRGMVPSQMKDCPAWDKNILSYAKWRVDVDFWIDLCIEAGMAESIAAGSIYFCLDKEDQGLFRIS